MRHPKGFTLVELLVVLTLVALLLALALPRFIDQTDRAKEAVLKQNLESLRIALDQHYGDKGHFPSTLDELVEHKYLRHIPVDPITNNPIWTVKTESTAYGTEIVDVFSKAEGADGNGKPYAEW